MDQRKIATPAFGRFARRLKQHYRADFSLLEACQRGNYDGARLAIKRGIDLDIQNHQGQDALQLALEAGSRAIVEAILAEPACNTDLLNDRLPPLSLAYDLSHLLVYPVWSTFRFSVTHWIISLLLWRTLTLPWRPIQYLLYFLAVRMCAYITSRLNPPVFENCSLGFSATRFKGEFEETILNLLQSGFVPSHKEMLLLWSRASEGGYTRVAQHLLFLGSSINSIIPIRDRVTGEYGSQMTKPLLYACQHARYELVAMLVENGVDVASIDSSGRTALFLAMDKSAWNSEDRTAESGAIIRLLLSTSARAHIDDLVPRTHDWSRDLHTPLGNAIRWKRLDATKILLRNGANPNMQDEFGRAALHVICSTFFIGDAHTAIVQRLIDHGAQVNLLTADGWSPLGLAAHEGMSEEVCAILLESMADWRTGGGPHGSSLYVAAKCDTRGGKILRLFLNAGAKLDDVAGSYDAIFNLILERPTGTTQMEDVVLDFLAILCEFGILPTVTIDSWKGPLVLAARTRSIKVLNWFLDHGATIDTSMKLVDADECESPRNWSRRHKEMTALSFVPFSRHESFDILLRHGVPANCDSFYGLGISLLEGACSYDSKKHIKTAALLIAAGADVNRTGPFGATPLHRAASILSRDHIQLLATKHPDRLAYCRHYGTPLHLCFAGMEAFKPWEEKAWVIDWLLQDGGVAALSMTNASGATPLHQLAKTKTWEARRSMPYENGMINDDQSDVTSSMMMALKALGQAQVKHILEIDEVEQNVLHIAASVGNLSLVQLLIACGRALDDQEASMARADGWEARLLLAQDYQGWTAVHHAAASGNRQAYRILFERGLELGILTDSIQMEVSAIIEATDEAFSLGKTRSPLRLVGCVEAEEHSFEMEGKSVFTLPGKTKQA